MQFELLFKVLDGKTVVAHGTGCTLGISSKSVLFRPVETLESIKPGKFVELSINWPVRLGYETPLRLVTFGRVIRSMGHSAACAIDRHEFRTQARVHQMPRMS